MKFKRFLLSMLCGALLFSSAIPTSGVLANEPIQQNDEAYIDYLVHEVGKFTEIDEKGNKWFNEEIAKEFGAKSDVIDTGMIFNSISVRSNWSPSDITHYGNWCGKGDKNAGPVDVLDYYCFKHDQCYASTYWGNKSCDEDFVDNLRANLERIKNLGNIAYLYARAAIKYFGG